MIRISVQQKTMEFTWPNNSPGSSSTVVLNHNLGTYNLDTTVVLNYGSGQRQMADWMSVTWPTSIIGYVHDYLSENSCQITMYQSNIGGSHPCVAHFTTQG